MTDHGKIVDLDRYRIDRPDTDRGLALIAKCRPDLEEPAICFLPGCLCDSAP